jgi:hypothetical protein
LEDKSLLVATYDGKHNHDVHGSSLGDSSSSSDTIRSPMANTNSFLPAMALDLSLSSPHQENRRPFQNFVEEYHNNSYNNIAEYAASLTKDPTFTTALAAAVASSITHQPKKRFESEHHTWSLEL